MTGDDLWDRFIESHGLGVTMTKGETIRLQAKEIVRLRELLREIANASGDPAVLACVREAIGE